MKRGFWLGWVIAFLIAWGAIFPSQLFDFSKMKIESSSDQAAWVQAIGSIIAIFVAIGFPLLQEFRQIENKRTKIIKAVINETEYIEKTIEDKLNYYKYGITKTIINPRYFDHYSQTELSEIDYNLYRSIQDFVDQIDLINALLSERTEQGKPLYPRGITPDTIETMIRASTTVILAQVAITEHHHTAPPSA